MSRQIEDHVFGTLIFTERGFWEKSEYLEALDDTLPLQVNADEGGPTEEQRSAYRTFKQSQAGLRADLQAALFAFYRSEREVYVEAMAGPDLDFYVAECAPPIDQPEEVWRLLDPFCCAILGPEDLGAEDGDGGRADTTLWWHGSWDVEHEFGAHFKAGRLLGIEAMGGVFYPYPLEAEP